MSPNSLLVYSEMKNDLSMAIFLTILFLTLHPVIARKTNVCSSSYFGSRLIICFIDKFGLSFSNQRKHMKCPNALRYNCYNKLTKTKCTMHTIRDSFENGDTLTQEDIVTKQYTSLPYPDISQTEIMATKYHYNSEFAYLPYMRPPSENLESLNHFLYEGGNDFK